MPQYKNYQLIIKDFYLENYDKIVAVARKVKNIYYSIPLEIEDLILMSFYYFVSYEVQEEFYNQRTESADKFFFSRLRYSMLTACNKYISSNHKIMNDYQELDDSKSESLSCSSDYYLNLSKFEFLTEHEFEVIYSIKVLKEPKKVIAKKLNTTMKHVKILEQQASEKIFKEFQIKVKK